MIYKLGVNIIRDLLHDEEGEFDDLLRLERWEGTQDFCWAITYESAEIRGKHLAKHT